MLLAAPASAEADFAVPNCNPGDGLEPNDDLNSAFPWPPSAETLLLSACPADDDYISISLGVGETVGVGLELADATSDLDLRLYDPSGAEVAASTSSTGDESVSWTATTAGDHVVGVEFISGAEAWYVVGIQVH